VPDQPFFPQLALFVAARPLLSLYREFIFPSVPRRTGLLPVTLDDIRTTRPENNRMAVEIALARAAVVVFDSTRGAGLSLDYIRVQRQLRPVVVVDAPVTTPPAGDPDSALDADHASDTDSNGEPRVRRPKEMTGWPEGFVRPLLDRIDAASPTPPPGEITAELGRLESGEHDEELVLTGLALLERRMRTEDLPTALTTDPTATVMTRLGSYFGNDYTIVISGVALRHDLLEGAVTDPVILRSAARALSDVVRQRYSLPPRQSP
jgi:hypothetical protein